jgi:hypothetical protein
MFPNGYLNRAKITQNVTNSDILEKEQFVERAIFILKLNLNMLLYMFLSNVSRSGYNYSPNLLIHYAFQHFIAFLKKNLLRNAWRDIGILSCFLFDCRTVFKPTLLVSCLLGRRLQFWQSLPTFLFIHVLVHCRAHWFFTCFKTQKPKFLFEKLNPGIKNAGFWNDFQKSKIA